MLLYIILLEVGCTVIGFGRRFGRWASWGVAGYGDWVGFWAAIITWCWLFGVQVTSGWVENEAEEIRMI